MYGKYTPDFADFAILGCAVGAVNSVRMTCSSESVSELVNQ
jgi:hypothetical protein